MNQDAAMQSILTEINCVPWGSLAELDCYAYNKIETAARKNGLKAKRVLGLGVNPSEIGHAPSSTRCT
jgi:hypothetical protein